MIAAYLSYKERYCQPTKTAIAEIAVLTVGAAGTTSPVVIL